MTQEQYQFVYDALLEALAVGDTAIPCSLYMQRYTELKRQNPSTGKSLCHEEFEVFWLFSFLCCSKGLTVTATLLPIRVCVNALITCLF